MISSGGSTREAIYHSTTDERELRRKRPDEARVWQGAPLLSPWPELRGDEGILALTPLREGWLPFLQGVAMAPEKPAWRNTPSSLISAMRDHEDRQIPKVAFNKGVYLYFGVPREVYEGLLWAESEGHSMRQHGIDRYPWIKKGRLHLSPDRAPQ